MNFNFIKNLGLQNCFIAGGAVLSTVTKQDISDYDVYPKNNEGLIHAIDVISSQGPLVNITPRALTFKENTNSGKKRPIVQIMTMGYSPTAESIFENFDFTVTMGAVDVDSLEFFCGKNFWQDVASRTLVFNQNTRYPFNSLIRVQKYRSKGYQVGKSEIMRMALTCAHKGMPTSWEQVEEEIGGTYGRSLKLERNGLEFNFGNLMNCLSNVDLSNYNEDMMDHYHSLGVDSNMLISYYDEEDRDIINVEDEVFSVVNVDGKESSLTNITPLCEQNGIPSFKNEVDEIYFLISDSEIEDVKEYDTPRTFYKSFANSKNKVLVRSKKEDLTLNKDNMSSRKTNSNTVYTKRIEKVIK